jgi:hypothetical protein
MPALLRRRSRALPLFATLAILASGAFAAHTATAQSATGTVTGRVLWSSCIRAIPLPQTATGQVAPDAQDQPAGPATPDFAPGPGSRPFPVPVQGLPAGAVLVAVQNTSVSARTDEAGKFTLSGVPAGQYLTVAAGPVADSLSATASRPNVMVNGGQSVEIGTLPLGGIPTGVGCRFPLGVTDVGPGQLVPGEAANP